MGSASKIRTSSPWGWMRSPPALPAAFAFHRRIGSARITERIHNLNEQDARVAFGIHNTTDEVEKTLAAVRAMAA